MQLCRKCVYDSNTTKYLVLTRDEVEQGDEKLKELEAELQEMGLYDSEFSLGDIMEEQEEETRTPEPVKKKLPEFSAVEGDETVVEYVGQYKRQCLNKKALLKSTKERLDRDKAVGHENLSCNTKNSCDMHVMLCDDSFKSTFKHRKKHVNVFVVE